MSSEAPDSEGVAVVRRLIDEGVDNLDMDAIEETTAEEVELLEKDTSIPREGLIGMTQALKDAMSDLTHEIHAVWETEENVIVHYTNHGTFENELTVDAPEMAFSAEPNGDEIQYSGVYIADIERGRITA